MIVKIITAFPRLFHEWIDTSVIRRSQEKGIVRFMLIDLHDYTENKFHQLDDEAYGGGGMVMRVEPIVKAVRKNVPNRQNSLVCLLSPQGGLWTQTKARRFSEMVQTKDLVLIAGRYEGIDARVEEFIDEFISIGDYVVAGGEVPAMIVLESIIRLLPGVINEKSLVSESFDDDLLDYSVYTRPQVFENMEVPNVYLSGNHKLIEKSRSLSRIQNTLKHRPDLYEKYLQRETNLNKNVKNNK